MGGESRMQEKQPLVSVIMPVYNAEKYLSEAIESVISQSYSNWELLIVDDGSNDNSISIIESYAKKDSRIRIYTNDSGEHGSGIARNYGMKRISGKYTYFMDADDWIEKDLLQDTVALAEKTGADIVPFGLVIEDNGKKIRKSLNPRGYFEFKDFKKLANEMVRGTWSECTELIRSELLQNMSQNKHKTCEDICFQLDLLCNVKKVCGIDKDYYHYRYVEGSASHNDKWDNNFFEVAVTLWNKEKDFLEYCGLDEHSQIMKNTLIERYTGFLYWICQRKCPLSLKEKYALIKDIGNKIEIQKYKSKFDCSVFSGIRRFAKIFVKYNLELIMIVLGTLFFKLYNKKEI